MRSNNIFAKMEGSITVTQCECCYRDFDFCNKYFNFLHLNYHKFIWLQNVYRPTTFSFTILKIIKSGISNIHFGIYLNVRYKRVLKPLVYSRLKNFRPITADPEILFLVAQPSITWLCQDRSCLRLSDIFGLLYITFEDLWFMTKIQ